MGASWHPQGHVRCLIDSTSGQVAETYRYSAFGEETIFNADGLAIATSQIQNPWRFAGKRYDPETGWIYFGRRYYEPATGHWTTPDPLQDVDGPNLYVYLHHNPLNGYDADGLLGNAYQDFCQPTFSRDYFPTHMESASYEFSAAHESCRHERSHYISNSNSYHAAAGGLHGGLDFIAQQCGDFASFACLIGADACADSCDERLSYQMAYANWQYAQLEQLNNWLTDYLGVDPQHSTYQTARAYTTLGLELGSLYSILKGAMQISRLALQSEKIAGRFASKELRCAVREEIKKLSSIDLVINETLQSKGMITSQYKLSASEALQAGEKFLGPSYREIGKSGSGVFRSTDGLRQFRIDVGSITGSHAPGVPHIHMEVIKINAKNPYINNHIIFYE